MKKKVGLWIDHQEAFLVTITDQGNEITRIYSNIEHFDPCSRIASARSHDTKKMHETQNAKLFGIYLKAIIRHLCDADSIRIYGPGEEARNELAKYLKRKNPHQRVVSIEATANVSEPKIAAQVRWYLPD